MTETIRYSTHDHVGAMQRDDAAGVQFCGGCGQTWRLVAGRWIPDPFTGSGGSRPITVVARHRPDAAM